MLLNFPLYIYIGVRVIDHTVILFWPSEGTSTLYSIMTVSVYTGNSHVQEFHFFWGLKDLFMSIFLKIGIKCEVISYYILNFHFLMINIGEHTFKNKLVNHFYDFSRKLSTWAFCLFLILLFSCWVRFLQILMSYHMDSLKILSSSPWIHYHSFL